MAKPNRPSKETQMNKTTFSDIKLKASLLIRKQKEKNA